ncbi:MAG: hypothetical protein RIA69_16370 [Cyclobacteriaceae bacterium]
MKSNRKHLLIALLTVIVLVGIAFSSQAQYVTSIVNKNGKSTFKMENVGAGYKVEYRGEFKLSDDDTDIISISRGGYIEISKSSFGRNRKVKIEADGDELIRQYYIGFSEQDYDPEGKEWLAEIIPDLVHHTTLAAENRVDRIYAKNGASGLIKDIKLMKGDYLTMTYLSLAFEKDLSDQELNQLLTQVASNISSDFYLSEMLGDFQKKYSLNATTIDGFLGCYNNIESDHYQTNILTALANNEALAGEYLSKLISSTGEIASDHYKTNVLSAFINAKKLSPDQLEALLESSKDIQSDHYLSNLLILLINKQDLSSLGISKLINTSQNIQSDLYQQNVLQELFEEQAISDSDLLLILPSVDNISSDLYLSNVLSDLLKQKRETIVLSKIFEVAGSSIQSDYYLSEMLQIAAKNQVLAGESLKTFVKALGEVSSDNYFQNVINKVTDQDFNEQDLILLINTCANNNSDYYLSNCLTSLAPKVNTASENVKSAYRIAAGKISSESYYGRAMRAIAP